MKGGRPHLITLKQEIKVDNQHFFLKIFSYILHFLFLCCNFATELNYKEVVMGQIIIVIIGVILFIKHVKLKDGWYYNNNK